MPDLGDEIGFPPLLAGPPGCYLFPCSREEFEDSVYAAQCRRKAWHRDEERRQARQGGASDKLSVPSGVSKVTRAISHHKGDNGSMEWRPGGYWRRWWERVIGGALSCEWKPDQRYGGLLIVERG